MLGAHGPCPCPVLSRVFLSVTKPVGVGVPVSSVLWGAWRCHLGWNCSPRDPDWVLGHGSEPEGPNPCPGGAAVQRPRQAAALAKEEMARDLGLSRGRESHGIWRCIFSGDSQGWGQTTCLKGSGGGLRSPEVHSPGDVGSSPSLAPSWPRDFGWVVSVLRASVSPSRKQMQG